MASDTAISAKEEKKPVADKMFVDGAGLEAEIEKATGLSYKSLASGTTYVYPIPGAKAGDVITMLALFGATTLATNTASFNRNSAKAEDRFADDSEAVKARFERIVEGDWGTRAGGGVGVDVQVLFDAITEITGEEPGEGNPQLWLQKMGTSEYGEVRKQLRNHKDIGATYDRIIREKREAAQGTAVPLADLIKIKI